MGESESRLMRSKISSYWARLTKSWFGQNNQNYLHHLACSDQSEVLTSQRQTWLDSITNHNQLSKLPLSLAKDGGINQQLNTFLQWERLPSDTATRSMCMQSYLGHETMTTSNYLLAGGAPGDIYLPGYTSLAHSLNEEDTVSLNSNAFRLSVNSDL